jgi:glycosyltransferase involved in cell wall biosynthesis
MRVALFTGNYNYLREGANQALNRLVAFLEGRFGDEVRVYSPVTDKPAFEPSGTLVPVPSIALPVRNEFRLALGLPRSIRRDVEAFAPDVIHVATPDILDTRAQTFAKRLGIPIVASLHTQFETYLDYYGLGWARPLVQWHLRRFYRRSDHVLVPTEALRAEMLRMRGDSHVSVWSRGVDLDQFNPLRRNQEWRRSKGIADEETVVLFFGRLVVEKGAQIFVSVVGDLQQRGMGVRPLIVGAGPAENIFQALPGAVLTGHLTGEELAKAVASADLLFHPSTTESFGNVMLEAMASGLAIVCARAQGAEAMIEHERTGILCPARQPATFATAIDALVADPERRRQLGAAASHASAAFSWDAASMSVKRAYDQVLERAASGSCSPAPAADRDNVHRSHRPAR